MTRLNKILILQTNGYYIDYYQHPSSNRVMIREIIVDGEEFTFKSNEQKEAYKLIEVLFKEVEADESSRSSKKINKCENDKN